MGECIFEKGVHTFVLAKVPGGLAKKLTVALLAETGTKYRVRVRAIDGSVDLDSETDVDPDATAASKTSAEIPKGIVEKRKFLLTRWRQLPVDLRPEVENFKAAVEQAVPEEDPDELGDAIEEALQAFYDELQDEIDRAINAGDMGVIKGLKSRVSAHPLVKHLVENPMVSGTGFQSLLIEALEEMEAKLAA
jgi:hypothetical protein